MNIKNDAGYIFDAQKINMDFAVMVFRVSNDSFKLLECLVSFDCHDSKLVSPTLWMNILTRLLYKLGAV